MLKTLFLVTLTFLSLVNSQLMCDNVADIVFAIDESGSIDASEFTAMTNLVKAIIDAFDLDPPTHQKVRVGIVKYSTQVTTQVGLAAYGDTTTLKNLVSTRLCFGSSCLTNISGALTTAAAVLNTGIGGGNPGKRTLGTDAEIPRVIFLLGDGEPTAGNTNNAAIVALANNIKSGGSTQGLPVMIFSVFVGGGAGSQLFMDVSSGAGMNPNPYFRNVNSFGDIPSTTAAIVDQLCTGIGMMIGDVHFTTHDGVIFTFNGGGDYVYMKSDYIDIHARDVYVGRATALAALALLDKETGSVLELWWDGLASERLTINLRHKGESNKVIAIEEPDVRNPFKIYKTGNGKVSIKHSSYPKFNLKAAYGGRASFGLNIPKEWKTSGLGGNNNGNVEDDLCNRTGDKCISVHNATNADVHQIGLDWKVLPSELLFEKWMSIQDWEIRYHPLSVNSEQLVAAKKVCGDVQVCIFDYISTGSEEYAKHTKNDYFTHILDEGKLTYVGDRY